MQKKKQKRKFSKFKLKQRFWPRLIWCLITDLKEKIMRNYCEKRWRGKHAAAASKVVDNSTSDNQALPYLKNPNLTHEFTFCHRRRVRDFEFIVFGLISSSEKVPQGHSSDFYHFHSYFLIISKLFLCFKTSKYWTYINILAEIYNRL